MILNDGNNGSGISVMPINFVGPSPRHAHMSMHCIIQGYSMDYYCKQKEPECRKTAMSIYDAGYMWGAVVVRQPINRWTGGSVPPTAVSKLRQFRLPHVFRKRH